MKTLLWGLFLACSWTWCIGMYLPKVMLDRFGWPGFVVFAVPNVIGCAGFGYALLRPERSAALVARHRPAMVAFSLVAVAYQLFFVTFLLTVLAPVPDAAWLPPTAAFAVFGVGLLASFLRDRAWLAFAAVVYAVSVVAAVVVVSGNPDASATPLAPARQLDLLWLAPVVTVGFLLCPYLDLTFHRALQRAPSRHAFGVFGLTFAPMVVLTCFMWYPPGGRVAAIVVAHVLAQIAFTVGAHLREVREAPRPSQRMLVGLPLIGIAALPASRLFWGDLHPLDLGEDTYIRILGFYGLVFPAYVLLFLGPWRPWPLSLRHLVLFALVLLVLGPALEAGFIHDRYAWLAAVPVALVGWIVSRRRRT